MGTRTVEDKVRAFTAHDAVQWVAAGLLSLLGVMVVVIITYDALTKSPIDPTTLGILGILLGIVGTVLGVNTAGNLYTSATTQAQNTQQQTVQQVKQIQNGTSGGINGGSHS